MVTGGTGLPRPHQPVVVEPDRDRPAPARSGPVGGPCPRPRHIAGPTGRDGYLRRDFEPHGRRRARHPAVDGEDRSRYHGRSAADDRTPAGQPGADACAPRATNGSSSCRERPSCCSRIGGCGSKPIKPPSFRPCCRMPSAPSRDRARSWGSSTVTPAAGTDPASHRADRTRAHRPRTVARPVRMARLTGYRLQFCDVIVGQHAVRTLDVLAQMPHRRRPGDEQDVRCTVQQPRQRDG